MAYTPKILAFAGSLRKDSFNKKLVAIAAQGARDAGASVTLLDLKEYPLPVYDGDDETASGIPENGHKLKKLFMEHDGLLISSPEYNSGYPGGLKNMIDWVSRVVPGGKPLAEFEGKFAIIMNATPGMGGGARMLPTLRVLLSNLRITVLADQFGLTKANEAFTPEGDLKDETQKKTALGIGRKLAETLAKLKA
jgi:NAD(P)H-dependent FMN reductase